MESGSFVPDAATLPCLGMNPIGAIARSAVKPAAAQKAPSEPREPISPTFIEPEQSEEPVPTSLQWESGKEHCVESRAELHVLSVPLPIRRCAGPWREGSRYRHRCMRSAAGDAAA